MHIQLLTQCNMHCAFCSQNSTVEGEVGYERPMDFKTYVKCLDVLESINPDRVVLTGGEPTMHENFLEWTELILQRDFKYILIAINGKITEVALKLKKLADSSEGKLRAMVSYDRYHECVSDEVYKAYEGHLLTSHFVGRTGRGKDFGNAYACISPNIYIKPDGDVRGCGCLDAPSIGNIFTVDPRLLVFTGCKSPSLRAKIESGVKLRPDRVQY